MSQVVTPRVTLGNPRPNSFTLVELLVVIAIIAILVAVTLQAVSGVMATAARNRAKVEIQAYSTALDSYKNDNGAYPQVSTMTATNSGTTSYTSYDPGTSTNYIYAAQVLYQALSGKTNLLDTPVAGVKSYATFKVSQLANTTATANGGYVPASSTYIQDPWSYAYGYNTGSGTGGATTNYPYNGNGFFDLWSTAGLTTSSTTAPNYFTNTATWIGNWQ